MIINNILARFNSTQQARPVQQPRFFKTNLTQPATDIFIKQPSFRAKTNVDEFVNLYTRAIQRNDFPLLKKMIEEQNWQGFYDCKADIDFAKNMVPILTDGIFSGNQRIRDLFNVKNLFNLAKQYLPTPKLATEDGLLFYLAQIYFSKTEDPERRKLIAEESCYEIYNSNIDKAQKRNKMSQFPMSDLERYFHRGFDNIRRESVHETMNLRLQRILSYNGDKTPEELLNCLNDLIMSPEILGMQYDGSRLIDKIASIPANEENKEINSKIAKKLSEMELPNNKIFRNAGVIAAKNGNAELLKVFDSKHIYYKTNLQEPISNFPPNVQEILENAKINDERLTCYANNPIELERYLAEHPNVGINSKDKYGNSLAIEAVKSRNFDTLKLLAKYDDFDWNMLDKNRNNLLTQLIYCKSDKPYGYDIKLQKQLLEFLRELPRGKFNINHTNYLTFVEIPSHFCFLAEAGPELWTDVIEFPDLNPNLKLMTRKDYFFEWCASNFELFKLLLNHPNADPVSMLDPITIKSLEDSSSRSSQIKESLRYLTSHGINMQFIKEAKDKYDKNGMLDLKEIEGFVNYSNFNQIMGTKFNVTEENIAHLLVDISPDGNNIDELMEYIRLFEKLNQSGFDFNAKDIFDRTPLDKAEECGNQAAINILRKYQ